MKRMTHFFIALVAMMFLGHCSTANAETLAPVPVSVEATAKDSASTSVAEMWGRVQGLWHETGLYGFFLKDDPAVHGAGHETTSLVLPFGAGQFIMMCVCLLLIYLAVFKGFEPLLLIPIGFGGLLANIPFAGITAAPVMAMDGVTVLEPGGYLYYIYEMGVAKGIFPILIFMGIGAMTDFGPLIANPISAMLGTAAQFGIFFALLGAVVLNAFVPGVTFSLQEAASIGIIGGADGPTSIWLTTKLAPNILGAVAVAAYSYMALVPIIQPPIMRLCTTPSDRLIKMKQLRDVSKLEKVVFPIVVTLLCGFFLPAAVPLIGALMLGNLVKECGVADRLSDTMAGPLINIVVILLGLSVGTKLAADKFLTGQTLGIILLGLFAFVVGTATGVLMARFMNLFLKDKINPLIGSAGVSAVPMAARVSHKVGQEYDSSNYLLMHAMGPNVAGVIGSAIVAGILYKLCM